MKKRIIVIIAIVFMFFVVGIGVTVWHNCANQLVTTSDEKQETSVKEERDDENTKLPNETEIAQTSDKDKKTDEELVKQQVEAEAQRQAEEQAKQQAEAEAQRRAEEQAKQQAEAEARRQAEEQAKQQAEAELQRRAEEQAKQQAEAEAQRQAEEQARQQAEEAARQQMLQDANNIQRVVDLVNVHRQGAGIAPLTLDLTLKQMADVRAQELVQLFSHDRPDGRSCFTIFDDFQVERGWIAENIAYGYQNADGVVDGWMNSEGHRNNIMNSVYTKIGVGSYVQDGTIYWVQLFMN